MEADTIWFGGSEHRFPMPTNAVVYLTPLWTPIQISRAIRVEAATQNDGSGLMNGLDSYYPIQGRLSSSSFFPSTAYWDDYTG
jgi:hypothetical protein